MKGTIERWKKKKCYGAKYGLVKAIKYLKQNRRTEISDKSKTALV